MEWVFLNMSQYLELNFGTSGSLPVEHSKITQSLVCANFNPLKSLLLEWAFLSMSQCLELNFMTRIKVCEFSNNFQRECKLEVEALYRRTDYIIFWSLFNSHVLKYLKMPNFVFQFLFCNRMIWTENWV